jgi:hypothetical protein
MTNQETTSLISRISMALDRVEAATSSRKTASSQSDSGIFAALEARHTALHSESSAVLSALDDLLGRVNADRAL